MAKYKYDLGNFEYCTEKGSQHDLKYALLSLSVTDTDNDRFFYSGSCVPVKCTKEELQDAFEEYMEQQYQYDKSNGLSVTFPHEEEPSMGYEAIIALSVYLLSIFLVISGTIVDRTSVCNKAIKVEPKPKVPQEQNQENPEDEEEVRDSITLLESKNKPGCFLSSYSIPRNFTRIFIDNFTMQNELKVFNGLFVLSLMLVIYNNVYFVGIMYGIVQNARISEYEHEIPEFILLRLRLVYEIFFFCIGFT